MTLLLCWVLFMLFHSLRPVEKRSQKLQYRLGLVLATGLGVTTIWTSTWYTSLAFFESDFSEYCVALIEMERDWQSGDIPPKRSRLAALLPTGLAQVAGVMNGFVLSSIICTVLIFVGVYVWGSALGGVGAGVLSVGTLWAMSPMALMPRFLTFYPPIVLTTVFAAASLVLWGRFRTPLTAFLCGLGVALCFLIDVRGVVWAIPFWIGGVCLLSWNLQRGNVLSALLLHVPIWASWFVGWWSYSSNAASLEKQLDVRPLYVGFDEYNPLFQPPWDVDGHFVWGWFAPQDLLSTIEFIWTQRTYPVPEAFLEWQSAQDGPIHFVEFWTLLTVASIIPASVAMLRRKFGKGRVERWLLLICSVAPFMILFHSLQELVEQHIRFYMHIMPGIAVLLGVGLAQTVPWTVWLRRRFPALRLPLSSPWRASIWVALSVALLIGLQQAPMSPLYVKAQWRHSWRLNAFDWSRIHRSTTQNVSLKPYDEACAERLEDETTVPTVYPE